MNRDPGFNLSKTFAEEFREYCEELNRKEPLPIFVGAILASGNELTTNKQQVIALFNEMQVGRLPYPESMRERVDYVEILEPINRTITQSEQIDEMFRRFAGGWMGVNQQQWVQSKETGYLIGERYWLTDKLVTNFLETWGNDFEALEFFTRCAKYLTVDS